MNTELTIIGSGLAAYNLARAWRTRNPEGRLTIICADSGDFYSKPLLSNGLAQKKSAAALRMKSCATMAAELKAEIHSHTRVTSIDANTKTICTENQTFSYQQLVLATGADPFTPPFSGSDNPRVLTVNDIDQYTVFRERVEGARKVVLLGGGLIGCEFANDLASTGVDVHVVELAPWPINRLLPEVAGRYLEAKLAAAGVNFHWQTSIAAVQEQEDGLLVELRSGEKLEADLLVSAVGLRPRLTLAQSAGLKTNRGIVVDEYLRSSNPDIYALGDCAEVNGLLLPYIQPIMLGARTLAATLSGEPTALSYPAMPVIVKTPACPLVVAPPMQADGEWRVENTEAGIKAMYYRGETPTGFALLGDATTQRASLVGQLPAWL